MTERAGLTSTDKYALLETFCLAQQWKPDAIGNHDVAVAASHGDRDYELLAKRWNNCGGLALKIVIYHTQEESRKFVGTVGYHNPDALPYTKQPGGELGEAMLYGILANSGSVELAT